MTARKVNEPDRCAICGSFLTTEKTIGDRCFDPAHWQAAGLFAPNDFYLMARIMAAEKTQDSTGSFANKANT